MSAKILGAPRILILQLPQWVGHNDQIITNAPDSHPKTSPLRRLYWQKYYIHRATNGVMVHLSDLCAGTMGSVTTPQRYEWLFISICVMVWFFCFSSGWSGRCSLQWCTCLLLQSLDFIRTPTVAVLYRIINFAHVSCFKWLFSRPLVPAHISLSSILILILYVLSHHVVLVSLILHCWTLLQFNFLVYSCLTIALPCFFCVLMALCCQWPLYFVASMLFSK